MITDGKNQKDFTKVTRYFEILSYQLYKETLVISTHTHSLPITLWLVQVIATNPQQRLFLVIKGLLKCHRIWNQTNLPIIDRGEESGVSLAFFFVSIVWLGLGTDLCVFLLWVLAF